jgi:hypothetical protein
VARQTRGASPTSPECPVAQFVARESAPGSAPIMTIIVPPSARRPGKFPRIPFFGFEQLSDLGDYAAKWPGSVPRRLPSPAFHESDPAAGLFQWKHFCQAQQGCRAGPPETVGGNCGVE